MQRFGFSMSQGSLLGWQDIYSIYEQKDLDCRQRRHSCSDVTGCVSNGEEADDDSDDDDDDDDEEGENVDKDSFLLALEIYDAFKAWYAQVPVGIPCHYHCL